MRLSRLLPVAAAGVLLAATMAPAHAQTDSETTGSGTTTSSLTVLGARAGNLLALDLLTDGGMANTDERVGDPTALASIAALSVESPAAGISQTVPVVSVESTGERQEQSTEVQPVDNPVVSGTIIPMSVSAVVGEAGAISGLAAGVTDLEVLGGLLHVTSTEIGLDSEALAAQADGLHGARVDAVSALDLDSLLAGLGIPLSSLSLDTLLGLVDSLGLLPALGDALAEAGVAGVDAESVSVDGLLSTADQLGSDITTLQGLEEQLSVDQSSCDVTEPAVDLLGQLTGQPTETLCDDVAQTLTDTTETLSSLTDQLGALLSAPVGILADQALVTIDGLDVSVVTTATDSVDTSVADITAALGAINVAGVQLDGLDLTAAAEQVNATVDQIEGTIGGVLSGIDPRLGDLVDITALESDTSVVEDAGAVVATADFTGLRIDVLPNLEDLTAIVSGLSSVDSVADQLTALGLAVPAAPAEVTELNSLLAGVPTSGLAADDAVFALSEGFTVEVASLTQQSSFAVAAAPGAPVPALPTTGSNDTLLLVLGAGAVVAALTMRRVLHRA